MADTKVVMFEGKKAIFPADATDAEISSALGAIPASNAGQVPTAKTWTAEPGTKSGLAMAAAGQGIPAAADAALGFATSPTAAKTAGAIGRVVGGVAPTVSALAAGQPMAALAAAAMSGKTSWAGGKAGYYTGKAAQQASGPVAGALQQAAPYSQALSTLGGAQGVLDLAQMSEPDRRDIGMLGVGPSAKVGTVPNADVIAKMPQEDAVKVLVDAGFTEPRAKSYVLQMRKLMANR